MSPEAHALNRRIGQHLRTARQARGDTLATVGRACGINVQQLSDVERGRAGLSVFTLVRAAQYFGASLDVWCHDPARDVTDCPACNDPADPPVPDGVFLPARVAD